MQFTKLRLVGFKSFVDATEMLIENGLTGVVGPNGCGKSNLVEALRWVMGETSAKSMRGSGMDDVIFGGTADRPSRNIAEVELVLDNSLRDAPVGFNDHEELQVSRRIERASGSVYRVNGRDARARDVQRLFADQATGAHATALVSQGRIGALISAKPQQRRMLLEEAADITGLHSRRHEAELRLTGAETNLERLDDVITALDGQLKNLKKQAAQARRYRRLSDHVRRHEAMQLHLRWTEAGRLVEVAEAELADVEATVAERTQAAAAAATEQAEKAAVLPEMRQREAAVGAELQRLLVARNELDAEEARLERAREENRQRSEQISGDMAREKTLAVDAEAALQRLDGERAQIVAEQAGAAEAHRTAKSEVDAAQRDLDGVESRLSALTERVASVEARRRDLESRIEELERRIGRLGQRRDEFTNERAALAAETSLEPDLAAAAELPVQLSGRKEVADLLKCQVAFADSDEPLPVRMEPAWF